MTLEKHHYAIALIVSMHVAGAVGLQYSLTRPLFEQLVVFNLLVSTLLIFIFHQDWTKDFFYFVLISFSVGFFVEVLGVQTGLIFGVYEYDTTLGFKVLDVPPMIGINWFILVYTTGVTSQKVLSNLILRSLFGAGLMLLLDYFIEPVAVEYRFWHWESDIIPLQNYLAWFLISFLLHVIFNLLLFTKKNKIAFPLLLAQFLFFLSFV